jgi:ABC-type antimicrobial peptide transport system permease subunit
MNAMYKAGCIVVVFGILWAIVFFANMVISNYQYTKRYKYAWNLADKASTIEAKSKYINEFVEGLVKDKDLRFAEYDALILKTDDNSFQKNLEALQTLQSRLNTIKTMDEQSFAYQTAIQQITAQEQGEAQKLLSVISECYLLRNYPMVWGWFGALNVVGIVILIVGGVGIMILFEY